MRLPGGTLVDGRIDTFPKPGATLLEPWDHDSADSYQRLESTLQSIRRYAVVKVIPAEKRRLPGRGGRLQGTGEPAPAGTRHGGLGHLPQRHHDQPRRELRADRQRKYRPATAPKSVGLNQSWIPQGRDTAAEQRILGQILDRFTPEGTPDPRKLIEDQSPNGSGTTVGSTGSVKLGKSGAAAQRAARRRPFSPWATSA